MGYSVKYDEDCSIDFLAMDLLDYLTTDTIVVCVGTDTHIGDSLGPLVGQLLIDRNFPLKVYGTLDDPITALNVKEKTEKIKKLHAGKKILAIDASVARDEKRLGYIKVSTKPVIPGKGADKDLGVEIGDWSIHGIVSCQKKFNYEKFANVRLGFILKMAVVITGAMHQAYKELEEASK